MRDFARNAGIDIKDEEPLLHDLDAIQFWLSAKSASPVDCDALLAAWNLFGDIARSTRTRFAGEFTDSDSLYEKLFFGSDTANKVIKPAEKPSYEPQWSEAENQALVACMSSGLAMFRKKILKWHRS